MVAAIDILRVEVVASCEESRDCNEYDVIAQAKLSGHGVLRTWQLAQREKRTQWLSSRRPAHGLVQASRSLQL